MSESGWIGVDLDGTLAEYGGWKGPDHIGKPVAPMVARVKQWLAEGKRVKIFTARVDGGKVALISGNALGTLYADPEEVRGHIRAWCMEHIGQELEITNVKDCGMVTLYDDRCVQVEFNTGRLIQ